MAKTATLSPEMNKNLGVNMGKQVKPNRKVFKKLSHFKEIIDEKTKNFFDNDENFCQLCVAAAMLKGANLSLTLCHAFPDQQNLLFLLTTPVMLSLGTIASVAMEKFSQPTPAKNSNHSLQVDSTTKN